MSLFQKNTKIPVITYSWISFSFFPQIAPVESKIGPRVIPPDVSRAPAELRAKRSFSQVPSGGRIQRSFPPSPTHPKCIWETFKTPLKRGWGDHVHVLYLLPPNSQETWTRAMHEMFTLTFKPTSGLALGSRFGTLSSSAGTGRLLTHLWSGPNCFCFLFSSPNQPSPSHSPQDSPPPNLGFTRN